MTATVAEPTEVGARAQRDTAGLAAGAALALALTVVGLVRIRNGWVGAFDLGVFDQAGWLLAHGHAHVSLIQRNIFADHVSPVLVVFAGLYRLHPTPAWLIVGQSAAIGATVVPMRRLATLLDASPRTATVAVLASTPILAAGVFDFHASTLAVPAIAWMLVGARSGDRRLALLGAAATIACRADLALVIAAAAIVAVPSVRRVLAATAVAGLAASALPAVTGASSLWAQDYGWLGSGPVDAALHPGRLAAVFGHDTTRLVILAWLASVGFVIVWAPRWLAAVTLAALPVLLLQTQVAPWSQYGAPIAPLLIGGALAVTGRRIYGATAALAAGLAFSILTVSTLSPLVSIQYRLTAVIHANPEAGTEVPLDTISATDVVTAEGPVVRRLAHRHGLFLFPMPFGPSAMEAGPPSPQAAARVTVAIVRTSHRDMLAPLGFTQIEYAGDHYVIARRAVT